MSLRKEQVIALAKRWAEKAKDAQKRTLEEGLQGPENSYARGMEASASIHRWHDARELLSTAGFSTSQIEDLIGKNSPRIEAHNAEVSA